MASVCRTYYTATALIPKDKIIMPAKVRTGHIFVDDAAVSQTLRPLPGFSHAQQEILVERAANDDFDLDAVADFRARLRQHPTFLSRVIDIEEAWLLEYETWTKGMALKLMRAIALEVDPLPLIQPRLALSFSAFINSRRDKAVEYHFQRQGGQHRGGRGGRAGSDRGSSGRDSAPTGQGERGQAGLSPAQRVRGNGTSQMSKKSLFKHQDRI